MTTSNRSRSVEAAGGTATNGAPSTPVEPATPNPPPEAGDDRTIPVGPELNRDRAAVEDPAVQHEGGHGHGLMMLVCCVPMLLIVFALVATGVAGPGAIVFALLCTAMMAVMMFAMPGHRH